MAAKILGGIEDLILLKYSIQLRSIRLNQETSHIRPQIRTAYISMLGQQEQIFGLRNIGLVRENTYFHTANLDAASEEHNLFLKRLESLG